MLILKRKLEAGASVLVCFEKKLLPTCLNQHLCNIKISPFAGQEQAYFFTRCFAENNPGQSVLIQGLSKFCTAKECGVVLGRQPLSIRNSRICPTKDKIPYCSAILIRCCS